MLGNQTELYRVLKHHLKDLGRFSFLQAGANDGLSHDPFREFIIGSRSNGILVEPLRFFFEQLKGNYRHRDSGLSFENCALSYPSSPVSFYTLDPCFLRTIPYDPTLWGAAGLSKDHLLHHLPKGADWEAHVVEVTVPAHTIEELMELHGLDSIDCLFLDLEGHEPNVLLNMDFERVRPRLIVYEHIHLGDQRAAVDARLASEGFGLHACSQDVVATRPD